MDTHVFDIYLIITSTTINYFDCYYLKIKNPLVIQEEIEKKKEIMILSIRLCI